MDEYLNQLNIVDASIVDEAHDELIHMKNPEFFEECKSFMPTCMQVLRDSGIR